MSRFRAYHVLALVLASLLAGVVASCSAAQSKADLELTAITGGCKVAMDLEKDAGAAEALELTSNGCRAAIKTWMAVGAPDDAEGGAAGASQ